MILTDVAAQVGGAPAAVTFDGGGVYRWDVAVGARVARAEGLATLGRLARVAVALRLLGVVDRSEAAGAVDGVAVHLLRSGGRKADGNERWACWHTLAVHVERSRHVSKQIVAFVHF